MQPPHRFLDKSAVMGAAAAADQQLAKLWMLPAWAVYRLDRAPISHFDRAAVKVAILARRSYGKTTLLNGLTNRDLLFAHWTQATSFPAYIHPGVSDAGVLKFDDGHVESVDVTREALAAVCAQFTKGRTINERTIGVNRLDLALANWPLPTNMSLIDLAGYDDSFEFGAEEGRRTPIAERAAALREEALEDADGVIVVLRPTQFLGEMERAMLTAIFERKGPRGVLPVLNIEVEVDDDIPDHEILENYRVAVVAPRVDDARRRYADFLVEIGIDPEDTWQPVCVSALAALTRQHLGDFGLKELHEALALLSAGPRSLAMTSRLYSGARHLQSCVDALAALVGAQRDYEARCEENARVAARNRAEAESWAREVAEESRSIVNEVASDFYSTAFERMKEWCSEPGTFWETYRDLNARFDRAAQAAAASIVEERMKHYRRVADQDGAAVNPLLYQELKRHLSPRRHLILSHKPNVGFLDELFGNPAAIRAAAWEAFINDAEYEADRTRDAFLEAQEAIEKSLTAYLPKPTPLPQIPLGAPPSPLSAATLSDALLELESGLGQRNRDFQQGRESVNRALASNFNDPTMGSETAMGAH